MVICRLVLLAFTIVALNVEACSRVFWNNSISKAVTRTMDLFKDEQPQFALSARGVKKNGGKFKNAIKWTSTYGSVVVTAFQDVISEGVNEKGFAAHLLYLHSTEYEKRTSKPGLSNLRWVEYLLDNFSSVDEALMHLDAFQIVSMPIEGQKWPLHLCMEDASGNSAIIEYVEGKRIVHHGTEAKYAVVTNEPAFEIQLNNLKKYKYFGGALPLPGDVDSMSRFVRASAFLSTLPQPKDTEEALGYLLGVIRNVQVPFGAEETSGNNLVDSWPTRWASGIDLTNLIYYFNLTSSPNIVWVELNSLDFASKKIPQPVNLDTPKLSGDLSKLL